MSETGKGDEELPRKGDIIPNRRDFHGNGGNISRNDGRTSIRGRFSCGEAGGKEKPSVHGTRSDPTSCSRDRDLGQDICNKHLFPETGRSPTASPCCGSTESLGDWEDALDPPSSPTPIGGMAEGGARGPDSTRGIGRQFSALLGSEEAWNEENIIRNLRELDTDAIGVFEAAWAGDVRRLKTVLKEGSTADRLKDGGPQGFRDGEGRTPLHAASACGHVDCVKMLIEEGAPVNAAGGKEGRVTPLICATSCGNVGVVQELLAGGANVNAGYEQGNTALHWAIRAGSVACAKILLEADAKQSPPQVFSETPLHLAASQGDPDCLQLLLEYGANVNLCKGSDRSTALHLSCEEGNAACVRLLLQAGASPAAKDMRGHTALHVAATCDADCVTALLQSGADPDATDAQGRTPLHGAVAREYLVRNQSWQSGLTGSRAAECVRLLAEKGADIDAQDEYGYTPLHLSAVNESSPCAAILLQRGSDVTLKNKAGINALSLLVRRIPEVMRHLVERMDAAVTIHDHDVSDPECEVKLDFSVIVPNCGSGPTKNPANGAPTEVEKGEKEKGKQEKGVRRAHKETEFLTCLMAVGHKKLLEHPLSEAFLELKWRRVRKFFLASLLFQVALVALLSIYVVEVYLDKCPYRRAPSNNMAEGPRESSGRKRDVGVHRGRHADPFTVIYTPLLSPGSWANETKFDVGPSIPRSRAAMERTSKWFGLMPPPATSPKPRHRMTWPMPPLPPPSSTPTNSQAQSSSTRPSDGVDTVDGLEPPVGPPATTAVVPPSERDSYPTLFKIDADISVDCKFDIWVQSVWVLLFTSTVLMATKEVFQLLQSPRCYVCSSENWGQWLLICSVGLTAWRSSDSKLQYWQYPAAACGIFLAWGLMLLQVGRFPALGVYVHMLRKVAANFGLFILSYVCLLIAFALSFCVLFPEDKSPYVTVPLSILKVITMMVGEVEYEKFLYNEERRDDPILFPITAHLLYGAFVLFVTIVLMNLLVGLAVHDIQGLQKGAKLDRLCRQNTLIFRLESFIFSKKLQVVVPRSLGSLLKRSALLVPSSYNWSFYFRPNDPRDKRLPKEIELAAVRLAANRIKTKVPPPPDQAPPQHRKNVASTSTPIPVVGRPASSVSHHLASNLVPYHHPEVALRRIEQKQDELHNYLAKTLHLLNRRMDQVLEGRRVPPATPDPRLSSSLKTVNNLTPSKEDHVFPADRPREDAVVLEGAAIKGNSSFLSRRRTKAPVFF